MRDYKVTIFVLTAIGFTLVMYSSLLTIGERSMKFSVSSLFGFRGGFNGLEDHLMTLVIFFLASFVPAVIVMVILGSPKGMYSKTISIAGLSALIFIAVYFIFSGRVPFTPAGYDITSLFKD